MKKISLKVTTSWDDGHKLDLRLARLLKKYSIKGTFYISPKDHEFARRDLLTKSNIKEINKNFEIGAHTITHPHLPSINLQDANFEIEESKKYLERVIGKKVLSFCYPYGDYNDQIAKLVKENGFILARTTNRYNFLNKKDHFALDTTFHTYNHFTDIAQILKFAGLNLVKLYRYTNWENLAIDLFKFSLKNGGTFHLFGHSWELEKFNDWGKLERVLKFISNKKGIKYVTNSGLVK